MTERINHAAEARRLMDKAEGVLRDAVNGREAHDVAAKLSEGLTRLAQVHATLAVREQLLVANVLIYEDANARAGFMLSAELEAVLGL